MDENFENIILDEEDDLNFGVESLREKSKNSHRENNNNQENLNKDVINLIKNEENHIKPVITKNENQDIKQYDKENEKELSEEYNDFEYNIEDNYDSGDKSNEKIKNANNNNNNFQKTPFIIDENNDLYGSSSNSKENIENNLILSSERNKNKKIEKESFLNNEGNNQSKNENNNKNNINMYDNNNNNLKEENEIDIDKEKEIVKNSASMMQMIEDNYYVAKNELENILSKLEFNSVKEITQQNIQLVDYISKLNSIVNAIINIFPKGEKLLSEKISKNKKIDREKETKEEKEKKIVGIYRREYLRLENKYQLIKDPLYKESLFIQLNKLQKEYNRLYEENNILREEQRKNELSIERKARNNNKEQNEVKRIEMDIDNIKSQINLLQKKVDKNKITIIENNKRINYYVEREKNLDIIAKEKYGIKEYEDIYTNQVNKNKMIENKNNLLRKIEIYEKGIETNKNKYEREIRSNEKIINDLEMEKLNLIYHYKELIGEEEFQNIIQNFKNENKNEEGGVEEQKIEKDNKGNKNEEEVDIKENRNENIKINYDDKNDLLALKENNIKNNINNNINYNKNENINNNKKYPEFLDFFKDEENDGINEINYDEEKKEDIKEGNNKEEKEIKIVKFEETNNSLYNKEKDEDESPPNEYEDLEEFQI